MPYTILARARKDISKAFCSKIKLHAEAGGICRPLTVQESINGIPGMRGIDGQKMSTAAGIRYGKTKASHLANDEYPYVYNQYVYDDVEEFRQKLLRGERGRNILNSNLKDEALKKAKVDSYRTRVFFSDELHVMILVGQYFGPIMSYMMHFPQTCHSAIGLNAMSFDWECVENFLLRKGEKTEADHKNGIIFDFKAYDKVLEEKLMRMAWEVMVDMAREMNYTDEDIKVMHGLINEKVTPYIAFNGTLIQVNFSHTSGNGCTATVGSIAGLLALCTAFYVDQDSQGLKNLNVLDFIRSIYLGDDCMFIIIYLDKIDFDFLRL
jgi:hypothetical protein